MYLLTEPLDMSEVDCVDDMWVQYLLASDIAPTLNEFIDKLAELFDGSYRLAREILDSLDCVGSDGDVLTALFVSWDVGNFELSGGALDQVQRHVSPDPLTGDMLAR